MIDLDDPRWRTLQGGYRIAYDPTPVLRRLATDWTDSTAWAQLWNELHHQGTVGEASYAAIPALVATAPRPLDGDWNLFALATTIETERHHRENPPLPAWLAPAYVESWRRLLDFALSELRTAVDPLVVRSALAVVALARGQVRLGALIGNLDESELEELANDVFEWSEVYQQANPPLSAG